MLSAIGFAVGTRSPGYWQKVDAPAHASGDLLLVNPGWNNDGVNGFPPTPSGWNLYHNPGSMGLTQSGPLYWRIANGTTTDNWYVSTSAAYDHTYQPPIMVVYRGQSKTNPIKRAASQGSQGVYFPTITVPSGETYSQVMMAVQHNAPQSWTWTASPAADRVHVHGGSYNAGDGGNPFSALWLDRDIAAGQSTGTFGGLTPNNGSLWGFWEIEEQQPPNTPTINGPSGTIGTVTPLLSATASDPDGDNVRCYFEVSRNSAFTDVVFSGTGSTVASGTASTLRTSKLQAGIVHYVRAYALDALGQSGWSSTVSFTTPPKIVSTYNYTGGSQSFTVPSGITSLTTECQGAEGGAGYASQTGGVSVLGGKGGLHRATVTTTPGEVLTLVIGGKGPEGPLGGGQHPYGFNGGGRGGGADSGGGGAARTGAGGSGGGRSEVKRGSTLLVVGGGGGGGGGNYGPAVTTNPGGNGGGTTGASGGLGGTTNAAGGGTQTAGGARGTSTSTNNTAGASYQGGDGAWYSGNQVHAGGGGGGGGYYGGGGGASQDFNPAGGGGGGSSYAISGATDVVSIPGARSGDGQIVLSYDQFSETANTAPTAPTLGVPAAGTKSRFSGGLTASWTHNDPNGDAQGGFAFRRTKNGVQEWWNGTGWITTETFILTATQGIAFPASAWSKGTYTYTVRTTDVKGAPGPYATERTITVLGGLAMVV